MDKQCLRCGSPLICLPSCGDISFIDQLGGVEERDVVLSTCILRFHLASLLYLHTASYISIIILSAELQTSVQLITRSFLRFVQTERESVSPPKRRRREGDVHVHSRLRERKKTAAKQSSVDVDE